MEISNSPSQVFIYSRGKDKAHPIYKEFSRFPPDGFSYFPSAEDFFGLNIPQSKSSISFCSPSQFITKHQKTFLSILKTLRIPKIYYIDIPKSARLVHSAQNPILNRFPWVVDFENITAFSWYSAAVWKNPIAQTIFRNLFQSPYCKGLLAWTTAAKESLLRSMDCSSFKDKIHVVHLVHVPKPWIDRSEKKGPLELLFFSGNFYYKGGLDVVLTAVELAKHCNIHLTIVSDYPEEVRKRFSWCSFITWYKRVDNEKRMELLKKTDILLHPGHSETYGFVILEAFSFGIPVISTDGYSAQELIESGVRGYVVKNYLTLFDENYLPVLENKKDEYNFFEALKNPPQDYIHRLVEVTFKLIESKDERIRMSQNASQSVATGIFSPARRKEVMRGIYEKALIK